MNLLTHTLDWKSFDQAIANISAQLAGRNFPCIYGEPRGGLVLAVALSHHLEIPLTLQPHPQMLWCDDIIDTGTTFRQVQEQFPQATLCTWVCKQPSQGGIHALCLPSDQSIWVIFPWESSEHAQTERNKYLSRISGIQPIQKHR